jgi:outer membrane protein assembly factor BamB
MKKNYTLLLVLFAMSLSYGQTITQVWATPYSLPEKVDRTNPAIADDGTVYIACDYTTRTVLGTGNTEPNFFAINPDKSMKWQASITEGTLFDKVDQIQSSPSINADGSIFMGGHFGRRLYKFNAATGTFITRDLGSRIRYTAPAYTDNGNVIILTRNNGNKGVRNLSPDLTTENWINSTLIDFNSTPAIASDGTIYAASTNLSIYAINPDGTQKWTAVYGVTGGFASSAIALANDGTVYLSAKLNTAGDGVLKAYNPVDGTEKWSVTLTGTNVEQGGPAVAADGTIYLGNAGGTMKAYNPVNGTELWSFTASGGIEVVPAIDNLGRIYFGTTAGNFYVLNSDGTLAYDMLDLGDKINSAAAIGTDGRIYVLATLGTGTNSGQLYALQTTATGLQTGGWPMYARNAKHTGNVDPIVLSTINNTIDGFSVYPNPVNNGEISIKTTKNGTKSIQIFDVLGKKVYSRTIQANETIKTSNLVAGIYILKVEENGNVATRKLIVN